VVKPYPFDSVEHSTTYYLLRGQRTYQTLLQILHFFREGDSRLTLPILVFTLLLIWLISREKPPYLKTYHRTRLDGTFSTSYEPWFNRYLDHVSDEAEGRLRVGPISPRDDLQAELYHPELPVNWQRVSAQTLFRFPVKRAIAGVLSAVATVALADSVSRTLLSGNSVFQGLGTTGLGFRQILALTFAVTVVLLLVRLRNSKMQTQGYLDGYSDAYVQLKSKTQAHLNSCRPVLKKENVANQGYCAELVAWMPAIELGSPRFVNPWKEARQIVGAIQGAKGQNLDGDIYLILLADRFDRMLAAEDDPETALDETFSWLESEGLAENFPESLEEAGRELIIGNQLIQERLYLMGIPGRLPANLTYSDPQADKVLSETTLTQWMIALCNKASDR